jgi:adenylate cyclase
LDPEAIVEFLASFRCRAMRAIEAHGGIVDKFVGDDVMGVFGVPIATPEDAANALAAGRALQAEIAAWNKKRRCAGRHPVSIGIGIHYGRVFAGVIEGGQRLEFRIEELTKTAGWPLLVSTELLEAAKAPCPSRDCHPLPAQTVRGRKEPLRLFAPVSGQ